MLAVDGWAVRFGTVRRGLGPPRPLISVPNVTAHPSMASLAVIVLLYSAPLLCGFNVPFKELKIILNLFLLVCVS